MTVFEILNSKDRVNAEFPGGGRILDMLNFGFSFIECQDHIVEHVVVSPAVAKKVLAEIPEAIVDLDGESIGHLWTARLMVSPKVKDNRIVYSNGGSTAVLFLHADEIK